MLTLRSRVFQYMTFIRYNPLPFGSKQRSYTGLRFFGVDWTALSGRIERQFCGDSLIGGEDHLYEGVNTRRTRQSRPCVILFQGVCGYTFSAPVISVG